MFADHINYLLEVQEAPDWGRLGANLPYEWVEQAVFNTGRASIRHRRLPGEQVVWLVIGLALYRHQSISEVVDSLDLALPDAQAPFVSKSAVAQARQRLGEEPLKWLFRTSAQAWSRQESTHYLLNGLSLLAMDGTTLRTADSAENRAHFGAQSYASGKVASYPQVRGVTLTSLPTHIIVDAAFGQYDMNEMLYAKTLLPSIPDHSLTLFDKGFLAAEILHGLTASGHNRHFLIPAKSNTKSTLIDGTPEDGIVQMRVSPQARKKAPSLPEFWYARAIAVIDALGRQKILLTSLTDNKQFKTVDIVACYSRRWQIETSYSELKQSMMGMALTLRSKTVKGVEQEIWGALTAYNLIRLEIAKTAVDAQCDPTDISFVRAFHTIQYELHWAAVVRSYGKLPDLLKRLRQRLIALPNVKRPDRKCDRVVKSRPARYAVRYVTKVLI